MDDLPKRADVDVAEVQKTAQAIITDFVEQLDAISTTYDISLHRKDTMREPKQDDCDPEFKEKFLANAPQRDMDHIVAEKKSW